MTKLFGENVPTSSSEEGQTAYLRCQQTDGHRNMFWYRQDLGQGLQLLFNFYYKKESEKGTNSSHFQADQPQDDLFRLNISSVQPEHSAVYFCASSSDTALQSHLLPLQKPHLFLVTLQPQQRKPQAVTFLRLKKKSGAEEGINSMCPDIQLCALTTMSLFHVSVNKLAPWPSVHHTHMNGHRNSQLSQNTGFFPIMLSYSSSYFGSDENSLACK
uniref:Ig-like domain-containing protein n=1 Tax=Terrapene triunguis TaxID=2587831 RepID=A0A674IB21_9SAUR